jgi:hypothetical protein
VGLRPHFALATRLFRWRWGGRIFFSCGIQKRFSLVVPQPCLFAERFGNKEKIAKILLTTG